jgi:hypothetical protein
MLNYRTIKSDRQWSATAGLSSEKFHILCGLFKTAYESLNHVSLEQAASNLKTTFILSTYEDCLFYVLYHLKTGNSYDVLGFHVGTDAGNALRMFEKYTKILEIALFRSGNMPKRNFSTLQEFQELLKSEEDIILDVTEMVIDRDHDYEEQKNDYSGKKKAY